jgi:ABC-2 type transport system ATP-binding protein
VTVILTTHDLDDVEQLSRRLIVIDHGRIVHDGTVAEVKARYAPYRTLVVDLERAGPPLSVEGVEVVMVDGPRQWLRFHRDVTTAAAVVSAVARTAAIRDLTLVEPDIEDVIREMYSEGAG